MLVVTTPADRDQPARSTEESCPEMIHRPGHPGGMITCPGVGLGLRARKPRWLPCRSLWSKHHYKKSWPSACANYLENKPTIFRQLKPRTGAQGSGRTD